MNLNEIEEESHFRQSVRGAVAGLAVDGEGDAADGAGRAARNQEVVARLFVDGGWMALAEPSDLLQNLPFASIVMEELGRVAVTSRELETFWARLLVSAAVQGLPSMEAQEVYRRVPDATRVAFGFARSIDELPRAVVAADDVSMPGVRVSVSWGGHASAVVLPVRLARDGDPSGHASIALCLVESVGAVLPHHEVPSLDFDEPAVLELGDLVKAGEARASVLVEWKASDSGMWSALALCRLLRAFEMVGCVRQALDMTARHVTIRVQFDKPLAAMPSVQQKMADMFIALEGSDLLARQALWRAVHGANWLAEVEAAAFAVNRAGEQVTLGASQLHGGVGYMMDFPLHHFYRRVKSGRLAAGQQALQLEQIAQGYMQDLADPVMPTAVARV